MILKNQKGITLVELLAAIVIVGFLTILIWRVFFQTIDYNSYAVTEQTLQQEANVILSTLQSLHTRDTIKQIKVSNSGKQLDIYIVDDSNATEGKLVQSFSRSGITYELYSAKPNINNAGVSGTSVPNIVSGDPSNNRITLPVNLVLSSSFKEGKNNHFLLSTTLSKLTTD